MWIYSVLEVLAGSCLRGVAFLEEVLAVVLEGCNIFACSVLEGCGIFACSVLEGCDIFGGCFSVVFWGSVLGV